MESDFTHLLAEESASCGGSVKLTPLQVHVKRRETERQVEFRLHSHAYLKQLEDDEAWLQLQPSFPGEGLAEEIFNTITCSPAPNQVTEDGSHINSNGVSASTYLDTICPMPSGRLCNDSCSASMLAVTQRLALEIGSQAVLVPSAVVPATALRNAVECARRRHELAWPAGEAHRWWFACAQLATAHRPEAVRFASEIVAELVASVLETDHCCCCAVPEELVTDRKR